MLIRQPNYGFKMNALVWSCCIFFVQIVNIYKRLQAFGLQATRLKNLSPESAKRRLGKSVNRSILPVCTGTSFDQRFMYIDLSHKNHPVGISSPLGMTRTLLYDNWFSFLASLTPQSQPHRTRDISVLYKSTKKSTTYEKYD